MWILPSACNGSSNADGEPVPDGGVIDAHCHVFNASDLPVRGFARRVVLGDGEDEVILLPEGDARALGLLPWIVAALAEFLLESAPSARRELAALQGAAGFADVLDWRPGDEARTERLARALRRVLDPDEGGFGAPVAVPPDAAPAGRDRLLGAILEETGVDAAGFGPAGGDFHAVAARLREGSGRIGRLFRWADWLTAPRSRLVTEYARLYGGQGRVTLLTPALVDFSYWLEDQPESPFVDQIRVMEAIQRLQGDIHLHCFAPFDPWREVVDRANGTDPGALELVKWAVEEMGFAGVKLYPPMGFHPAGNAARVLPVPERAAEIPDFAAKIDDALAELFEWASREGVAVMAHATDSNGANDGYALRARPRNWAEVLAKHQDLRLNLGHFGGFDETQTDDLSATWEQDVGALVAAGVGTVFADMSYFSEVLPGVVSPAERARLSRLLRTFADTYDPGFESMLYGSDWLMLGIEGEHELYLRSFRRFLDEAGIAPAAQRRIFAGNAVRFLGLGPGARTRRRLEAWHRRHGLDDGWLSAFDTV